MDTERIFQVLGIEQTKEEKKIREAYRNKLVSVNPEDNPEGFKKLRKAYEDALIYARQTENMEEVAETPVSLFLKRLDALYQYFPNRLNEEKWEELLKDEILDDLEFGEEICWSMFFYLANHYQLPAKIWKILGRVFHIQKNEQEFKEHLHENFVEFMLWKISDKGEEGEFPYEKFEGEPRADYDGFINDLNVLFDLYAQEGETEREQWLLEIRQKIAGIESYGISHPWFLLEKAKYAFAIGNMDEAVQMIVALWDAGEKDDRLLLGGAKILYACGMEEEAEAAYRSFLERDEVSGEIYSALFAMAEICLKRGELVEARDHALRASRMYNTTAVHNLMMDCNEKLIEFYTKEKGEELTLEEGIRLAWCYIQNQRSEEAYEYFQEHPVLNGDTAKCHRVKAILFLSNERAEDALEETRMWRAKLQEEGETDPYPEAQSYEIEGRCLRVRYQMLDEKETEEAEDLKVKVLSAFEEALLRQPEDIEFHMSKMLFLREIKNYVLMEESCVRMIELDKDFFWAYFYVQEAYEALEKAQEVVDTFYEAKRIYAKRPEIYERAVRVFWEYGQYGEMENIIRQAEEEEIENAYIQVRKLELKRKDAMDVESIREVDAFAQKIINELEEKRAADENEVSAEVLADAYMERVYIHENRYASSFRKLDEMEDWLQKAVALNDSLWNRYYLGRFYVIFKKQIQIAYDILKICEERGMDFTWLYNFIAACHEEFEQWDDAIVYYKKAMEKAPDIDDNAWRIAWLYRRKFGRTGQMIYYQEAMKYLEIQIERFGKTSNELWQLSDLHARNMEYEKALEEIEQALKDDTRERNWGHKAMLLESLGRQEEAVICYNKAIEVGLENGTDYDYSYCQMYDYFCRNRMYEDAIRWMEERIEKLETKQYRYDVLERVKYLYALLGKQQKSMEIVQEMYGGVSLTELVCDSWEKEGKRIAAILDAYQLLLSDEELAMKAGEAASLMESEEGKVLEESREGKKNAYLEIGHSYADVLDDEKALYYFQKALNQVEPFETDEKRKILDCIIRSLWHMGRVEEAREYGNRYLECLGEKYKECEELERTVEELLLGVCGHKRDSIYKLFIVSFFGGDYQKAEDYIRQLEVSCRCWNCFEKECVEEWECKGYLALVKGNKEEALTYFKHALACSIRDNYDARREIKRIERQM